MIVKFSFGNHNLAYTNIRDIDLSMYDEVMLTSMSAPEFKLTMDYDVLGSSQEEDPINDFSYWWREFKQSIFEVNVTVTIKDNEQNVLAKGRLYSYDEDRENFAVEFTCKSEIGVWLDEDISMDYFGPNLEAMTFYPYDPINEFRMLWKIWFNALWIQYCGQFISYQLHDEETLLNGLAQIVKNLHYASIGQYYLKVRSTYYGNRAGLLKLFAQFFNAKFIYDGANRVFHIIPFKHYQDNPIDITGFVSNEEYDSQEQVLSNESIIGLVKYRTVLAGNPEIDITGRINDYISSRLVNSINFKRYDIWGYANQIIYTGFTIKLDGVDYYVQDVEYETETLDSLKSFKAKGIRFF